MKQGKRLVLDADAILQAGEIRPQSLNHSDYVFRFWYNACDGHCDGHFCSPDQSQIALQKMQLKGKPLKRQFQLRAGWPMGGDGSVPDPGCKPSGTTDPARHCRGP